MCRSVDSRTFLNKMGRKGDITEWQKGVSVFGHAKGHFMKEAAELAGVSTRTGIKIYKQWQNFWNTNDFWRNCERKKILTDRGRHKVSKPVNRNWFTSRQELLQNINFGLSSFVSKRTLRRELYGINIWNRLAHKRLLLTAAHKTVRLQKVNDHKLNCGTVELLYALMNQDFVCLWTMLADAPTEDLIKLLSEAACGSQFKLEELWDVLGLFQLYRVGLID